VSISQIRHSVKRLSLIFLSGAVSFYICGYGNISWAEESNTNEVANQQEDSISQQEELVGSQKDSTNQQGEAASQQEAVSRQETASQQEEAADAIDVSLDTIAAPTQPELANEPVLVSSTTSVEVTLQTQNEEAERGTIIPEVHADDVTTQDASTVTLTLVYDPVWKYIGFGTPDKTYELAVGTYIDMSKVDGSYTWYTDASLKSSTKVTSPFQITEDLTLYVGATSGTSSAKFHLSYNSNGGSYIRSRGLSGPTYIDFDDENYIPTRVGYTFTGWYTDFDLTERLSGTVLVASEMTVVAGWQEIGKESTDTTGGTNENSSGETGDTNTDGSTDETESLNTGISVVRLKLVYDQAYDDETQVLLLYAGEKVDMSLIDGTYAWYTDKNFASNSLVATPFTITENTTLYAGSVISGSVKAGLPTLTLVYDCEFHKTGIGRIPDKTITYLKGDTVDVSQLEGSYEWYEDSDFRTRITNPFMMSEDKVIYTNLEVAKAEDSVSEETASKEEPKTVTLKLVYDQEWAYSGKGIADRSIKCEVGYYVDVAKVDGNYSWYEDASCTIPITSIFMMTTNKTIYGMPLKVESISSVEDSDNFVAVSTGKTNQTSSKVSSKTQISLTKLAATGDSTNFDIAIILALLAIAGFLSALVSWCIKKTKI
jgi:uncharacterized repeat protein (TIGR02543 family)